LRGAIHGHGIVADQIKRGRALALARKAGLRGVKPAAGFDVRTTLGQLDYVGGVEDGPQTVIDALLEVLGNDGTLIMPTFNFDFCKGEPWDVRNTPSHMGAMTNMVRQHPAAKRVFHPIYSFAILGKTRVFSGNFRDSISGAAAPPAFFENHIPYRFHHCGSLAAA